MVDSSYERIAAEYYKPRHITSRNFDQATEAYFSQYRPPIPSEGRVLDVGAGRGTATEILAVPPSRAIHLDASFGMLTLPGRADCGHRIQADALAIPLRSGSMSTVVAFLYDPYNRPAFYDEVARVLKSGGIFIGTLPSSTWGKALRTGIEQLHRATFVTDDGSSFSARSFLMDVDELTKRFHGAGMRLSRSDALYLPRTVARISPDIAKPAAAMGVEPWDLPIVQLLVAEKPK